VGVFLELVHLLLSLQHHLLQQHPLEFWGTNFESKKRGFSKTSRDRSGDLSTSSGCGKRKSGK